MIRETLILSPDQKYSISRFNSRSFERSWTSRLAGNIWLSRLDSVSFAQRKKAVYSSESGFSACPNSSINRPLRSGIRPLSTADLNTLPRS